MMKIHVFDRTAVFWPQALCTAVLTLMICSTAIAAKTESHPMRFDRLSLDDGLSQSAVISIHQDSRGLMWFGTENGLNSYNGYEFEHFKRDRGNANGLASDFIYDIAEDSDGNLWLATNGGGLAKMDRRSRHFRMFRHEPASPNSVSSNVIRTLLIDAEGTIWLGTRGAGLDRFDPEKGQFTHFVLGKDEGQESAEDIYALYKDSAGAIWAGSDQGLYRLNPKTGESAAFRHDAGDASTISDGKIRSILEDADGQLWVGTYNGGLNRFDKKAGGFERFRHDVNDPSSISHDRVAAIFEDSDGRLWIGTSMGLNLMDREHGTFTRYTHDRKDASSLSDNAVTALFQDRGGVLWVGTLNRGVSKWNPRTWTYGFDNARQITAKANTQPNVTAIADDAVGTLWVGTFGEGLNAVDRENDTITRYRHDPTRPGSISDDRVMSLMIGRDGLIWAGTMTGGVNRLDPKSGSNDVFRHDPKDPQSLSADGIMTIYEDSNGRVWVGTFGGGISRLDPQTGLFKRFQADASDPRALSSNRVTSFVEDASGSMWIGTDAGGLNLFDAKTESFHHFRHDADTAGSLADDTVYSLNVGADGTLWVGTRGGGLDRVIGAASDPANISFANISQADGLTNDVIYGIEIGNSGELWLSTNYGISRFDPKTGDISNMHRSDGLQSEEFNFGAHYRSDSGELFFGGHNGFNAFHPENLQANKQIPLIMLTGLFMSGQPIKSDLPIDEDNGVEFSYKDDVLSFEFAALDYAMPAENRYMYKLEGFDSDWIDLGNRRRVTYTDLNDGQYTLRVKAANSDGVWNEAGFSMPVVVTPAPWDTWWAYLVYLAAIVQVIVAFWKGHKRKLRREEEYSNRLESEVQLRTVELAERNNELKDLNVTLQESSLSDPLTGLKNRRFVFEEVSRDLEVIRRKYQDTQLGINISEAADLVFMMIDLDVFKPINDTYGHAAGDKMLLDVRDLLVSTCRKTDIVVRWGGDEFVVIAKQSNPGDAEALAERIRSRIAEHNFVLAEGQIVRTTCSIGFAAYPLFASQADDGSLDQVMNLADQLMYEAKRKRNAWAGMLGISEAATSANFDLEGIEPSSMLFRARREGKLSVHGSSDSGIDSPVRLAAVG
jgi:diguanylate cyclase (GGDEF)-like protein